MAVKSMPGTIRVALAMSVVQMVWSVVSLMATLGTYAAFSTVVAPDGTTYSATECLVREQTRDGLSIGSSGFVSRDGRPQGSCGNS